MQEPSLRDLPPSLRDEAERLLLAYERAWRSGHEPDPAEFLPDDPAARRAVEAELALIGAERRASRGTARTPVVPGHLILRELGRGAFGTVYLARHERLSREVAVKVVRADPADEGWNRRFVDEARMAASVRHPGIVQVLDAGEDGGSLFISMEHVAGGSLEEWLRKAGRLPTVQEAAALTEALARAIHHAHEAGIVHRDLKPSNVLLEGDGLAVPKVADFGLARRVDAGPGPTLSGAVLGTPAYMPPEQARGEGSKAGPAADVWALGAILYECLAGRPPFLAATAAETLLAVVADDPVPPRRLSKGVPRDLETVCLKCLRKEPGRRYASALALADDLRRFLEGRPVAARPVGMAERGWRWCRRNPAAALALAAALMLAAALPLLVLRSAQAREQQRRAELLAKASADASDGMARLARLLRQSVGVPIEEAKQALAQAEQAFDDLLRIEKDNPAVRQGKAELLNELSRAYIRLGDTARARASAEAALALFAALLTSDDRPEWRRGLSTSQIRFGIAFGTQGENDETLAAFLEAQRLREAMASEAPDVPDLQMELAEALAWAGVGHALRGDQQRSKQDKARALAIRQRFATVPGARADHREALGRSHVAVGEYKAALRIADGLVRESPANVEFVRLRIQALNGVAFDLRFSGKTAEAQQVYRQALAVIKEVRAFDPDNPSWPELALSVSEGTINTYQGALTAERIKHSLGLIAEQRKTWARLVAMDPLNAQWATMNASLVAQEGLFRQTHADRSADRRKELEAACEAFDAAYRSLGPLAARRPENVNVAEERWRALYHLASAQMQAGDALKSAATARRRHEEAIAFWENRSRREPAQPQWKQKLAAAWTDCAALLSPLSVSEAASCYLRARELYDEIAARPSDPLPWRFERVKAGYLVAWTERRPRLVPLVAACILPDRALAAASAFAIGAVAKQAQAVFARRLRIHVGELAAVASSAGAEPEWTLLLARRRLESADAHRIAGDLAEASNARRAGLDALETYFADLPAGRLVEAVLGRNLLAEAGIDLAGVGDEPNRRMIAAAVGNIEIARRRFMGNPSGENAIALAEENLALLEPLQPLIDAASAPQARAALLRAGALLKVAAKQGPLHPYHARLGPAIEAAIRRLRPMSGSTGTGRPS